MKKILTLICTTAPFLLFAQQKQFSISGQIVGTGNNSEVYLINPDNQSDTIAKSKITKNKFSLKGALSEEKLYNISFSGQEKGKFFFLDNSKMNFTGEIAKPDSWSITGSKSNDEFVEFKKVFDPYFSEYKVMSELASKKGVTDSLRMAYSNMVSKLTNSCNGFSNSHKDSKVTPFMWVTTTQLLGNNKLIENQFNSLSKEAKDSYYGQFLAKQIEDSKIGEIGTQAIEFNQADTSGNLISLSSYKGKYLLVDFWASWCGPCRQENPNVVNAYNKFKDKNFTILGVSLDRDKTKWLKAIKDDSLEWAQVSDLKYWQNEVAVKYRIQSIPQNLLIDPNGIIIGRNLRGAELDAKLCEILGCN